MMTIVRSIPITENGQLIPEAGMLVLGYMMYPNCERSAHQFTRILAEETVAKVREADYQAGDLLQAALAGPLLPRLLLSGQVAIRVCKNHQRYGAADFRKAAHVVSEVNSTLRFSDGKPLSTSEGPLRTTFRDYRASMHFWAAASTHHTTPDGRTLTGAEAIAEMHISSEFLGHFLATAKQYEDMLEKAKPADRIWSASGPACEIWDFDKLPKLSALPDQTPEELRALSSYRTPKKS